MRSCDAFKEPMIIEGKGRGFKGEMNQRVE